MYSAGNSQCKHFDCSNRTDMGYCKTTLCIHPRYSQIGWFSPRDDAVCVVRCKDCENAIDIGKECLLCPMIDCRVKADFYCAYGERRK